MIRGTLILFVLGLGCVLSSFGLAAEEFGKDGTWTIDKDEGTGHSISTLRLVIRPMGDSQPVFKYRLMPDDFDLRDGNSAIHYLKALGFFEQTLNLDRVRNWERNVQGKDQDEKTLVTNPIEWLQLPLHRLPLDQVREYLGYLQFQIPCIERATRLREFELDRHIREEANPMMYHLSEIQVLRDLARKQSLRCRLALAESDANGALKVLMEQYTLANHLGHDEFLVSTLVGAAIANMATTDALLFVQMNSAPNLYWAIAALPDPLIDMKKANSYERQFMFEQLKVLREVGDERKPFHYWQDFIDRLVVQMETLRIEGLFKEGALKGIEELNRETMLALIEQAYPGTKQYLLDECNMDAALVENYTKPQVVFLAATRFSQILYDEYFKWNHVPLWQSQDCESYQQLDQWREKQVKQLGWPGEMMQMFLVTVDATRKSQCRVQQSLALLQTIEALRLYAALHPGQLPQQLSQLPVPVPIDSFTGKSFSYEMHDNIATLRAAPIADNQFVIHVQLAEQ